MRADYNDAGAMVNWNDGDCNSNLPSAAQVGLLPSPKKQTILWVDDSSALLSLYQAVFGRLGFEIVITSSPQEALKQAGAVDLAILDYDMPDMNGAALAALIKGSHGTLPVVLYSGNGSIPDSAHQWVDAICAKGAPREELLSTIDRLSNKRLSYKRPFSGRPRSPELFAPSYSQHSTISDVPIDVLPSSSESAACICVAND
jgi:DNA-binding NtrC family response regulator